MSSPDFEPARYATDLLDLLDLEELDINLYRGRNEDGGDWKTLFGGQVAAQALIAAARTAPPGRTPHSLHGYFLRPGRPDRPVILQVDRDRDGRSFSARHVVAVQRGRGDLQHGGVVPPQRGRARSSSSTGLSPIPVPTPSRSRS